MNAILHPLLRLKEFQEVLREAQTMGTASDQPIISRLLDMEATLCVCNQP